MKTKTKPKPKLRARKMFANYHVEGYVCLYSTKDRCMNSCAEHVAVPVAVIPLDDPMIGPALSALGIRLAKGGAK